MTDAPAAYLIPPDVNAYILPASTKLDWPLAHVYDDRLPHYPLVGGEEGWKSDDWIFLLSCCKSHQQRLVPGSSTPSVRLRSYHTTQRIVVIPRCARKKEDKVHACQKKPSDLYIIIQRCLHSCTYYNLLHHECLIIPFQHGSTDLPSF